MTNKAKAYYERMYGRKWDKFTEAERRQFEENEASKLPVKGEKMLKKETYKYHSFPKHNQGRAKLLLSCEQKKNIG